MQEASIEYGHIPARHMQSYGMDGFNVDSDEYRDPQTFEVQAYLYKHLRQHGICLDEATMGRVMAITMDALQPTVLTGSIETPVQFLQAWLPGLVYVLTAARKIDALIGLSTTGSWEDEEIVQQVMELTGNAMPYGDYANLPYASWLTNFQRRTVVRFEEGMEVGRLEEARSAKMRIDSGNQKRQACGLYLEIIRNAVGFFGYNNGLNRTYGFLNDPALPAYVTVDAGAGGTTFWADKTMLEIVRDIKEAVATLRNQSQANIDPKKTPMTLAIATSCVDFLGTISDLGFSVQDWLTKTYPNIRVEDAPQLNAANGGQNVFYLYADEIMDEMSTDDRRVFSQNVPTKFMVLGVQQVVKGYKEGYSNATAGTFCKRPFGVVRRSGI